MAVSTISATLYPSISIAAEHDFDAVFGIPALMMVKCFYEFIHYHEILVQIETSDSDNYQTCESQPKNIYFYYKNVEGY